MAADEQADLHGRPPLSIPFPLQLSEEGILPRMGADAERVATPPKPKNPPGVSAPVRPGPSA